MPTTREPGSRIQAITHARVGNQEMREGKALLPFPIGRFRTNGQRFLQTPERGQEKRTKGREHSRDAWSLSRPGFFSLPTAFARRPISKGSLLDGGGIENTGPDTTCALKRTTPVAEKSRTNHSLEGSERYAHRHGWGLEISWNFFCSRKTALLQARTRSKRTFMS